MEAKQLIYKFNQFTLDTDGLELTESGEPIEVEPQVFSLLACLIENRHRVVTKDEIIEMVWDGRIVSDGTLNSRINAARKAVGDDGKSQAVIKTFPRRGFRWVAEVREETSQDDPSDTPLELPDRPSIVVLPFTNLSNDPDQEFFADGITEDITMAVSRIRQFFVIARNTAFTYKGQAVDISNVAKEIGVRYVLEGSVRKSGDRIRVSVELVDCETGGSLWTERYDRDVEDLFAVQDEITQMVVGALGPELEYAEMAKARTTSKTNLTAWEHYQKGLDHLWRPDTHAEPESLQKAINEFENVLKFDPDHSSALGLIAVSYSLLLIVGHSDDGSDVFALALDAGNRAVGSNSADPLAQFGLSMCYLADSQMDRVIYHSRLALEINPSFARARMVLANALTIGGQPKEAISELNLAIRHSPRDLIIGTFFARLADAYIEIDDIPAAIDWAEKAVSEQNTQIWGNTALIAALALADRMDEAKEEFQVLLQRRSDFSIAFMMKHRPFTGPESCANLLEGLRKAGVPEE